MKALPEPCISGPAIKIIHEAGHDVVWVGDWPHDPGDEEILRTAFEESRVVVTIDKDFGELAIVQESSIVA